MGKHEAPPPFKMVLESGRLVPAAAWDQERLATYRNRSVLTVRITQEKSRPLERKYWAILNRVVKDCPVKWRTSEDAHKAIKLALGVVEPFLTVGGKMHCEIKSTAAMEEPEYREFFDDAMTLLERLTGVDPLTLHAESADVGREHEPSDEPSPGVSPSDAGGDDPASSPDITADQSAPAGGSAEEEAAGSQKGNQVSPDPQEGSDSPDPASSSADLKRECIDKLLELATHAEHDVGTKIELLDGAAWNWSDTLGEAEKPFVKQVYARAAQVTKGELPVDKAKAFLEGLL